jgi:hypothetical protein
MVIIRKQIIRVVVAVSMIMVGMAGGGMGQTTGIDQPAVAATRADVNGGASATDFAVLEERARTRSNFGTPHYDADEYYQVIETGFMRAAGRSLETGRAGVQQPAIDFATLVPDVPENRTYDVEERQKFDDMSRKAQHNTRVVGGRIVLQGEYTETVALVDEGGSNGVCTGTVVGRGQVLTAAHCVCAMQLLPSQHGEAKVYFGNPNAVDRLSVAPSARVDRRLTKVMDNDFCMRYAARHICGGDLAMVYHDPASTPDYVRIARLMTKAEGAQFTRSNDVGSAIVGYGETRDPKDAVPRIGRLVDGATKPKMFAVMTSPLKCSRHVQQCTPSGTTPGCLPEVEVRLFDIAQTKDTCNGDSGGPLFMGNEDSAAPQVLAAVTSRAMSPRGSCGSGGIYTSVFSEEAIAWLKTVMRTEP